MARLIETVVPQEKIYVIELTKSEIDALGSVLPDLIDPARKCSVNYPVDGDTVRATEKFVNTVKAFSDLTQSLTDEDFYDYDYFDWFESIPAADVQPVRSH